MTGEKVVKQKGWGGLPGRDEVFVEDIQDVLADVSQLFLHLDEDVIKNIQQHSAWAFWNLP